MSRLSDESLYYRTLLDRVKYPVSILVKKKYCKLKSLS